MTQLCDDQLKYYLALMRAPLVGASTFAKLIDKLENVSEVFKIKNHKFLEKLLSKETIDYLRHPDWIGVDDDLTWRADRGNYLLTLHDEEYPHYLREINNPPFVLYVKGTLKALQARQIAIVGSRNASYVGKENAFQFAYQLAEAGIVITSGLARGIDAQSHEGALAAKGQTIAVLGSGIDRIYPKQHTLLAEKIITNGALISEFPLHSPPLAKHFPQRNRIISGLSRGVLVIEAAKQSGSLLTARLANEQGRDVFAIPGSIHNALSTGCHHLIKEGAKLVEGACDILEELGMMTGFATPKNSKIVNLTSTEEQKIWNCLNDGPVSIDKIILYSGLTISDVSSILLSFESIGLIRSMPEGYLRLHF